MSISSKVSGFELRWRYSRELKLVPGEHDVTMPSGGGEIGQMVWKLQPDWGLRRLSKVTLFVKARLLDSKDFLGESSFSPFPPPNDGELHANEWGKTCR